VKITTINIVLLAVLLAVIAAGCKQSNDRKLTEFDRLTQHFQLLEESEAAVQITRDTIEHFFDLINAADLRIQLKLDEKDKTPFGELLQNYQQVLKQGCKSFNESEKTYVLETLEKAKQLAEPLIPELFDTPIQLIKYTGNNYGQNVYYTRENAIIIPAEELKAGSRRPDYFLETMLHELFHLYSRKYNNTKEALYALIGFKPVTNLQLTEQMLRKRLLNPDGMNLSYAIELKTKENQLFKAFPFTFSFSEGMEKQKKDYLHHLAFDLYRIDSTATGWQVLTSPTGYLSTISYKAHPEFVEQIGNNTDYIIHPDEILADNFALLALSKQDPSTIEKLDDYGKSLLKQIEQILTR